MERRKQPDENRMVWTSWSRKKMEMDGVWIANHIKYRWTKDRMENAKNTQMDRTKEKIKGRRRKRKEAAIRRRTEKGDRTEAVKGLTKNT